MNLSDVKPENIVGEPEHKKKWTADLPESPAERTALENLFPVSAEPLNFQLANDPPRHQPARFDNQDRTKQRKLLDGLDCLPGQMDLFEPIQDR